MAKRFPQDFTQTAPDVADLLPFSDVSDANNLKKDTVGNIVSAGLAGSTTDNLPEGTKKYMTSAEKTKLANIEPFAQENTVDSVNGQTGAVTLTQDNINDGSTYKRTHNDYTTVEKDLVAGYQTHQTRTDNPHIVTKAQI
jgi:hypothetical protein